MILRAAILYMSPCQQYDIAFVNISSEAIMIVGVFFVTVSLLDWILN